MGILKGLSIFEKRLIGAAIAFYIVVILFSLNLPFFSDGIVQSSIAAQWFFDNDFQYFFIPEDRNPGHPPFWGMYLAGWWKVFGQELWVGHLAMLPFLLGIAWQYFFIARYFLTGRLLAFAMVLLALEPTLLAMSTQVSPEIALVFFFLLSLRGLLYNRTGIQVAGMCALPLLNTRGAMLVAVIFVIELILIRLEHSRKFNFRQLWKYVVVGFVVTAWLALHYFEKGWIGYNREDMPWAKAFEPVNFEGWLRNLAVLGWRFLDFGRVALWLVGILIFMKMLKKRQKPGKKLILLLALALSQVLVFAPVITRYVATLQHRYLIPALLLFSLAVVFGLRQLDRKATQNWLFALIVICLLGGHFWVYPDKISQGWEASLAHIPYFKAKEKIHAYIFEKKIDPNTIATGTPLKYRQMDTDLVPVEWKMADHDEVDIKDYSYALYSNISNDWPDETYDMLHNEWELVTEQKTGGVVMRLFRKPGSM